ncbi:MAG: isoprenylcysteine carboxylmethyltransferase family protein [Sphingomonas sp.]
MDIDKNSAGVRFPPPLVYIGALLAGLALERLIGRPGIPLFGNYLEHTLGWLAVAAGLAIMLTAIGLFRKAETERMPWKPATALVTDGVYRWTRNPMYLGMALVYAGIALLLDSLVTLLLLIPLVFVIQKEVIEREERYMEARFGDAYRAYKASARRWV